MDVLEDRRCKSGWNPQNCSFLSFFTITASLEINHRADKLLLLFSRKLTFRKLFIPHLRDWYFYIHLLQEGSLTFTVVTKVQIF